MQNIVTEYAFETPPNCLLKPGFFVALIRKFHNNFKILALSVKHEQKALNVS